MSEHEETPEELPAYILEHARSSRSRCKTCQRKIDQGKLRLGVLVDGRYGPGHMWHHLNCAAKRMFDRVEEAYGMQAWRFAKEPPEEDDLPDLAQLAKLKEKAEQQQKERKEIPYAERAPSGRSKCKHSGDAIPKDAFRVVLAREVSFGNQVRRSPINVLPRHVSEALQDPESAIERKGFEEALRANSSDLSPQEIDEVLAEIGPLE